DRSGARAQTKEIERADANAARKLRVFQGEVDIIDRADETQAMADFVDCHADKIQLVRVDAIGRIEVERQAATELHRHVPGNPRLELRCRTGQGGLRHTKGLEG